MQHSSHEKAPITDFLTDTSANVGGPERIVSAAAGGALLAYGLKNGGVGGTLLSVLGGAMLYRGATGHCHIYDAAGIDTAGRTAAGKKRTFGGGLLSGKVHVKESVSVNQPVDEVYRFWKDFDNFPSFMQHVESVTRTGENLWHWKAKAPLGSTVEWDAELTSDQENDRIGWRSIGEYDIPNSGTVEFRDNGDRGTTVTITLTYEAPGGKLGEWVAWALGEEPSLQVAEDLRRFKMLMETGEVITTEGQPTGKEPLPRTMAARSGGAR
jgi:uncharacterized membrane protein